MPVLDRNNTQSLKFVLAMMVLLHHILQYLHVVDYLKECNRFLRFCCGDIVASLGVLPVAFFLFLTGVGLGCSIRAKGSSYARTMFVRKIIPLYMVVLTSALLYLVFDLLMARTTSFRMFLATFAIGDTIIVNGWYLQAIMALYIMFASFFSLSSCELSRFGLVLIVGAYFLLCKALGLGSLWTQCLLAFPLGFYIQKIGNITFHRLLIILFLAVITKIVAVLSGCEYVFMLYVPLITTIFYALATRIKWTALIPQWAGGIYLEIYIVQGIFLIYFRRVEFVYSNPILYLMIVSIATILFAKLLSWINKGIKVAVFNRGLII